MRELIGQGVLNWNRTERVCDRYGAVHLSETIDSEPPLALNQSFVGNYGKLIAVVTEARESRHIGDFFRGVFPETPGVDDEIELGEGTLFFEGTEVGLMPADRRDPEGFAIYRHVHRESGKDYVGVTEYGVDRRWVQHIRDAGLGSSQPLHQAIREFGPEAFDHEVLERCPTRNEANAAERKWIAHYRSNKTGYNLDAGGGVHSNEGEPERELEVEAEGSMPVHSAMIGELEDAFSG